MPRLVSAKEFLDLSFPLKGNDASNEFWRQADLTTVLGVNVRGDVPTGGLQGGSRMGLLRFIDAPVSALGDVVQHLNVVVDPQAAGLNADVGEEDSPDDYIPDPSTSNLTDRGTGRFVPPGGSGRTPNRNIPGTSGGWALRQFKEGLTISPSDTLSISLDDATQVGSILVVVVTTSNTAIGSIPSSILLDTVRNSGLVDYANVGGTGYCAEVRSSPVPGPLETGSKFAGYMWWRKASAAEDQDVVITAGATCEMYAVVMEFTGSTAVSPLDAFNKWTEEDVQLVNPLTTLTGVQPTASGVNELVVAGFGSQSSDNTPTPLNGYSIPPFLNGTVAYAPYKSGVSFGSVPVPALDMTSLGTYGPTELVSQWGVSATFKKT